MSEPKFYPHLFQPLELSGHLIANRSIMGSMHTGLEEAKNGFLKMAEFYRERAKGGAGLIITGGIAPHWRGWVAPFSGKLTNSREVKRHQIVTHAVHAEGGKIAMQILHAGRYSYHPFAVAPSAIKSPISPFKPFGLSFRGVKKVVQSFINCAYLAQTAGYDGVEVMGSEGYLINQFLVAKTNKRKDAYGGDFEKRSRIAIEIVEGIRKKCGPNFIIIFRLSLLDLVDQGGSWDEAVLLAHKLKAAGVSLLNTGIGWHEARIPTIATCVPRAAFAWVTEKIRKEIDLPIAAVNRINTPEVAEQVLAKGQADFVTMARPFLADSEFMNKAASGHSDLINTCIACNQACLDHVFQNKRASCLVNPRACYELEYPKTKAVQTKSVAVIGGGPAGMAAAVFAAERGIKVSLFEASNELGGQFNFARKIPGKEEFNETMRYYKNRLKQLGVDIKLSVNMEPNSAELRNFNAVLVATGVRPRTLNIEGIDSPKVMTYGEAIVNPKNVGQRVAVIGSGGIGIDVSSLLVSLNHPSISLNINNFKNYWGIDDDLKNRGGLKKQDKVARSKSVTVFQRSGGKPGQGLGKTTAWIHRQHLKKEGVQFESEVEYKKIDDEGLHYLQNGKSKVYPCDNIVICAGQVSNVEKWQSVLEESRYAVIGGAKKAGGIDAKNAIRDALNWAQQLP